MTGRTLIAMALGAASVAAALGSVPLLTSDGPRGEALIIALGVVAMATVGVLLAVRVPANKIAWLLLAAAMALGLQTLGPGYAARSIVVAGGSWPGTAIALWIPGVLGWIPVSVMAVAIPLIYPDGRLLSPRWRWLVLLIVGVGVMTTLGAFRPGPIPGSSIQNPFGVPGMEAYPSQADLPAYLGLIGLLLFSGAVASVAIRYRRAGQVERAQLKWLIAATSGAAIAWSLVIVGGLTGAIFVTGVGWVAGLLAFTAFPVAIGVAVLRYRLYEIDRIISRSIAWTLVTGALIAVFGASVVGLQAALTGLTQGDTLAVAVSTLAVAALFQPLRRRVQRLVDRRFDRASYDGHRTVEAFAERLRDEVDLDAVTADLEQTVSSTVRPTSVGLWLGSRGPSTRAIDRP